jgi:hypothetical protein
MRHPVLPALLLSLSFPFAHAYMTIQSMRDITAITDECAARIKSSCFEQSERVPTGYADGQQVVGQWRDEDDDGEAEDVCSLAIHM